MKKIFVLFLLFFCLFTSCEKMEINAYDALMASLQGKWAGLANPTDTIDFDQAGNPEWFVLNRGYEYRDGYSFPVLPSGVYAFHLYEDSISIQNVLLSYDCNEKYYFSINEAGDEFIIGDFIYHQQPTQSRLTFRKIK